MTLTWWSNLPQLWRYAIVLALAAALSVAGVVRAVHLGDAAEGVRGGALTTIVALCFFSLRPDWGRETYIARIEEIRSAGLADTERLTQELAAVVQWITINSNGQFHQNVALALASFIGTVFWGFGDKIAQHFLP